MKQDFVSKIKVELRQVASQEKADILARFFKTGKGEYGEGDKFLGVVVPEQRRIAKGILSQVVRSRISGSLEKRLLTTASLRTTLTDLQKLLQSKWHEESLTAILILVELYKKGDSKLKKQIFNFYLKNIPHINNWDLVDLSAPNIVGDYLFTLSEVEGFNYIKNFLFKLARSRNLWSRRVAVLATFTFIRNKSFAEILALAEFLIFQQKEKHDLMFKALGWMLREVGKRDKKVLENFLVKCTQPRKTRFACHGAGLPRTTLRYAIERFPEKERQKFLKRI